MRDYNSLCLIGYFVTQSAPSLLWAPPRERSFPVLARAATSLLIRSRIPLQ